MRSFTDHFSGKPAFSLQEARRFLDSRDASAGYYKLVIQNLIKSDRIKKIASGYYTFHDEVQYVGFAFFPFYYGLEDALSLREIWNQQTNPVVITPRKVRNGVRQFDGRNYVVRRIDRKMFFGYDFVRYEEVFIPVSNVEKTFIDFIYFHETLPVETLQTLIRAVDPNTLQDYLSTVTIDLKARVMRIFRKLSD